MEETTNKLILVHTTALPQNQGNVANAYDYAAKGNQVRNTRENQSKTVAQNVMAGNGSELRGQEMVKN